MRLTLHIGEQNQFWPQGRVIESSQFQDNATWQAGKHSIKFGGEFNHFPETDYGIPYLNGFFVFTSFDDFIQSNPNLTLYAEGPSAYPLTYNAGAVYVPGRFQGHATIDSLVGSSLRDSKSADQRLARLHHEP